MKVIINGNDVIIAETTTVKRLQNNQVLRLVFQPDAEAAEAYIDGGKGVFEAYDSVFALTIQEK